MRVTVSFLRKYAGGTLADTSFTGIPSPVYFMTKDKQDEAQRHAQRDALISKVFKMHDELRTSCMSYHKNTE